MKPKTVDEYIAMAPAEMRDKLQELRTFIREIVPSAEERISYGMPFYDFKGRLVYFALMKNHIGLYIPPPIIEQHSAELEQYGTTKSAVHLPLTGELPKALIKKLVKARAAWNDKTK
jgi:uncharacterized protein YdhG (YjbR/CyaY superfamily)